MTRILLSDHYLTRKYGGLSSFVQNLYSVLSTSYTIETYKLPTFISSLPIPLLRHIFSFLFHLLYPSFRLLLDRDLFYISPNAIPAIFCFDRTIVVIHDLAFLEFPSFYKRQELWMYRFCLFILSFSSSSIVTVSKYVRSQILQRTSILPSKVSVIYNLTPSRAISSSGSGLDISLPPKFLLLVSNAHPRKNISATVKAFASSKFASEGFLLYVVGNSEISPEQFSPPSNVKFLFRLSDADLDSLYRNCTALLLFSYSEGFGYPIVEAACFGKVSITSGVTSLPELTGDSFPAIDEVAILFKLDFFHDHFDAIRSSYPFAFLSSLADESRYLSSWSKLLLN